MKSISLWKISVANSSKLNLDELYLHKKTSNELHIACLYNLPSYRTGVIGYVVTLLCSYFPKTYVLSSTIRRLRWWADVDIFSRSISYINRLLPVLNYGSWNAKQHFLNYNSRNSIFHYGGENNKSLSGMFSICEPFFDSGCAIVSNTRSFASDFVPFDAVMNRGMLWSYYDDYEVLVITISSDGNAKSFWDEMLKIMNLQKQLSTRYLCKNSYIIGDFKSIIYEQQFYELYSEFQIECIEELSVTTYLIHDHIYSPQMEKNLVKFNPIVESPHSGEVDHQEERIVMSPITETIELVDVEDGEVISQTIIHNSPDDQKKTSGDESPTQNAMFPYLIFNYFSSNKTPPSTSPTSTSHPTTLTPSQSPPTSSPPSQSPKSDDGWSKV